MVPGLRLRTGQLPGAVLVPVRDLDPLLGWKIAICHIAERELIVLRVCRRGRWAAEAQPGDCGGWSHQPRKCSWPHTFS